MACVCGLLLTRPSRPGDQAGISERQAQTAPATYRQKVRTFHTVDEFKRLAPACGCIAGSTPAPR